MSSFAVQLSEEESKTIKRICGVQSDAELRLVLQEIIMIWLYKMEWGNKNV